MSSLPPGVALPPPPPPPPKSGSGMRACLIAFLVVFLVLAAGVTTVCVLIAKAPGASLAWAASKVRGNAVKAVSADVPPELKAQFETELDAYIEFLREPGNVTSTNSQQAVLPFQQLQQAMSDRKLTAEEIEHFLETSRTARGASK